MEFHAVNTGSFSTASRRLFFNCRDSLELRIWTTFTEEFSLTCLLQNSAGQLIRRLQAVGGKIP